MAEIEDISKYHEFLFTEEGIHVRYLPGFGEGETKTMSRELEENHHVPKFEYEIMNIDKLDEELQFINTSKPLPFREEGKKVHELKGDYGDVFSNENGGNSTNECESDDEEEKFVYKCKNPIGCTKTFMRRSDYLKHCQNGDFCEVPVVKQSSNDQIIKLWISKNGISQELQGKSYRETRNMIFHKELLPTIDPLFLNSAQKEELEIGHALPKGRKNTRFSTEQTQFLTEKFRSGVGAQKHKRKKIPQIALEMQMKFDRKDWLTETQIQSFFVRMAAKQKSN